MQQQFFVRGVKAALTKLYRDLNSNYLSAMIIIDHVSPVTKTIHKKNSKESI